MNRSRLLLPILLGSMATMPAAQAATGNGATITGTAQATVIRSVNMTNTAAMRFGDIVQPSASGTVTLSPTGTVTATGGAAGNQLIAQSSGGPAPGEFTITTAPGTLFTVYGPVTFMLSNGGTTMPVSLLTGSLQVVSSTPTDVTYRLRVGGTLTMAANQAVGTYSGSYTLQTVYQ